MTALSGGACDYEFNGWVQRLRNHLEKPGSDNKVFNLDVPSDTSRNVLDRFEEEYTSRKSDNSNIIIFSVGLNDSRYDEDKKLETTINNFKNNIRELYDKGVNYTNKVIFTGLTRVDESRTKPTVWNDFFDNKIISKYDSAIRGFCEAKSVQFIPFLDLLKQEDLNERDGIHPNSSGHEKIFERVTSKLKLK